MNKLKIILGKQIRKIVIIYYKLLGVSIGKNSIIGAGSVVTKNIPSYSIAIGNPARVIKNRLLEY